MRGAWRWARCALAALLLAATGARAAPDPAGPAVSVRVGNHPDFGRVVFDVPARTVYRMTREGDRVTIRFGDDTRLSEAPGAPRNVLALRAADAQAEFVVTPGATVRDMRLGGRVVIDVFDPPGGAARPPPSRTRTQDKPPARPAAEPATVGTPATPPPAQPPPTPAPTPGPAAAEAPNRAPEPEPPSPAPVVPVLTAAPAPPSPPAPLPPTPLPPAPEPTGPVALIARPAPPPEGTEGTAFTVPFTGAVGAALFRRGASAFAIFDQRRPIDLSGVRGESALSGTTVHLLPDGTLIRLRPPAGMSVVLSRTGQGWKIATLATPPRPQAILPTLADGRISLPAEAPGAVISAADPDTGATLLVGTQRQPGQGVVTARRGTEFVLLPTAQGVVVEPLSDSLALRVVPGGFALSGMPAGLVLTPPSVMADAMAEAARLTRRFAFPAMPTEALARRLSSLTAESAATPPLARGPKRRMVAETMIALGMAAEADALLHVAAAQDPHEAASPDAAGLAAIAAMLAGRAREAAEIDDPRLSGSDEVALWRAIRLAMLDEDPSRAAATLAATASLLFVYPPAMRERLLPLALETMIRGGETATAARLLAQRKDDPGLAYARAMLAQATGETDKALAHYDALAGGRSQLDRARAAVAAVELRLSSGRIDAAQAADALDKLLYAWRGDRRDMALRLRLAELRQQTGAWRAAFAILRQAESDFPPEASLIRARLKSTFAALLHDEAADRLAPLDLVALVDENADLVAATQDGDAMQERLAERLLALDLPKRADQLLDKLMRAAPAGAGRAGFGMRLAALRLREGDAPGAITALGVSGAADLPAPLREKRTLLRATAEARRGDTRAALAALAPLSSAAGDEARATILEQAQDWPAAAQALTRYVARTVPASGALDDAQRAALLRLATAAARAGDEEALSALREREEARIGAGPLADMFRLLTADPVRGTGDLKRSASEVGLARALPAGLKALRPAAATP